MHLAAVTWIQDVSTMGDQTAATDQLLSETRLFYAYFTTHDLHEYQSTILLIFSLVITLLIGRCLIERGHASSRHRTVER